MAETTQASRPRLADIGEPKREITVEPIPKEAPVEEPAPPVTVPSAPDKELEPV